MGISANLPLRNPVPKQMQYLEFQSKASIIERIQILNTFLRSNPQAFAQYNITIEQAKHEFGLAHMYLAKFDPEHREYADGVIIRAINYYQNSTIYDKTYLANMYINLAYSMHLGLRAKSGDDSPRYSALLYQSNLLVYLIAAIKFDPDNPDANFNLGLIYSLAEQKKAIEYLDKAIKFYQKKIENEKIIGDDLAEINECIKSAYYYQGLCHHILKNHKDAVAYFQKSIDLGNNSGEVYLWCGVSNYLINNYDEAILFLQHCIGLGYVDKWKLSEAHLFLALAQNKMNQTEEVFKNLELAIHLDSVNPVPNVQRAHIHDQRGDVMAAQMDIVAALDKFSKKDQFSSHYYFFLIKLMIAPKIWMDKTIAKKLTKIDNVKNQLLNHIVDLTDTSEKTTALLLSIIPGTLLYGILSIQRGATQPSLLKGRLQIAACELKNIIGTNYNLIDDSIKTILHDRMTKDTDYKIQLQRYFEGIYEQLLPKKAAIQLVGSWKHKTPEDLKAEKNVTQTDLEKAKAAIEAALAAQNQGAISINTLKPVEPEVKQKQPEKPEKSNPFYLFNRDKASEGSGVELQTLSHAEVPKEKSSP